MATPKVCGIETEYGILLSGAEVDPITASSLIVSAYKDSSWAFATFDATCFTVVWSFPERFTFTLKLFVTFPL